jgi:hypothetical protein
LTSARKKKDSTRELFFLSKSRIYCKSLLTLEITLL